MNTTTWLCPKHPFGHQWDAGLVCALCDATRTAHRAIASGLASARGWNEAAGKRALDAYRAEVLREAAENHPGELAMLRGLLGVVRVIARHGDIEELRRVVAEYDTDESAAYDEEADE